MTELAPGVYEHLVTRGIEGGLARLEPDLVQRAPLDPADAHDVLARHLAALTRRALRSVRGQDVERLAAQIALANRIADAIGDVETDDLVAASRDLLTAIVERPPAPVGVVFPLRPEIPLATSALLVNGRGQPQIGSAVRSEMASAERVDLLCAFIKWYGLRLIEEPVRELIARGGELRVITTTYMGATEKRALDRLIELGAQVRISYDTRTTRLHAKAWLFRRGSGVSTAYVGSSNLSKAAMVDGLEWNVRLAEATQPDLIDMFAATFEQYWDDPSFEEYDPEQDGDRLRIALSAESGGSLTDLPLDVTTLDVHPYGYQREILDELSAEREIHGHHRNLVVMATGTGKTIVAALDYRRLRQAGRVESLLFVAHQSEILRQSRSVFRHVLSDGAFGELLVDGERPETWRHVFASVQSLSRLDVDPKRFDMVIVDEFHHAEAPTYARLLERLEPKILLGLTATPERADGQDITRWFGGRTAAELRLWEALERQLLSPFQYFGIHDEVDLSHIRWKRGQGYDAAELEKVYTGHHARARLILQAVIDKVDVHRMRAIGFCVSIGHAEFMADYFAKAGIRSRALTSRVPGPERLAARRQLESGELRVLFTVDLFNEGIDIKAIDTVMLLRPTESATIFLQQIGRGLRLDENKACLTVLDFIGAQHAEFRFDLRYRALTGTSRRALVSELEREFPTLPAGCHIQLDRVAKQVVLANLQSALRMHRADLARELGRLGDVSLSEFLADVRLDIEDLYRRKSWGGWSGLRRLAQLAAPEAGPRDVELGAAIGRMLHIDDPDRLAHLALLVDTQPDDGESADSGRLAEMAHYALWRGRIDIAHTVSELAAHPDRREEIRQVIDVLRDRMHRVTHLVPSGVALRVHARYSRDEACIAFGVADPSSLREGVKWVEGERADLFFVTLTKTEQHYSATTMYQDRAITPSLFQWESQSTTSTQSPTGQRYVHHAERGSSVHLFVRESKESDGDLGAPPYLYAGPMTYVSHTGDRPMRVRWHLENPLPADIFHAAQVAAG